MRVNLDRWEWMLMRIAIVCFSMAIATAIILQLMVGLHNSNVGVVEWHQNEIARSPHPVRVYQTDINDAYWNQWNQLDDDDDDDWW